MYKNDLTPGYINFRIIRYEFYYFLDIRNELLQTNQINEL